MEYLIGAAIGASLVVALIAVVIYLLLKEGNWGG
jgi:hypothetical protein